MIYSTPSASPYRHWNERTFHECYEPSLAANFDVGTTLLSWLRQSRPLVCMALSGADEAGLERWGYGDAVVHLYYHVILPLVPRRDRDVLVYWGVEYFKKHF